MSSELWTNLKGNLSLLVATSPQSLVLFDKINEIHEKLEQQSPLSTQTGNKLLTCYQESIDRLEKEKRFLQLIKYLQ